MSQPAMIMPVNGWDRPVVAYRGRLARASAGGNHLYSVAAITDASGAVARRYAYGAYGQQEVVVDSAPAGLEQAYGFTGRRLDGETGLWYFRTRYCDDELGIFLGRDTFEYVNGMSQYSTYFNPNDLDAFGAEVSVDECKRCRDEVLENDQFVLSILYTLRSTDGCQEPDIPCNDCIASVEAMYFGPDNIQIYTKQNVDCDDVKESVRHELIHAQMQCLGYYAGPDEADCEGTVCTELAAASGSGQCAITGSDGSRFNGAGLSRKECVLRSAAASSSSKCGGYRQAKARAEEKYDECASRGPSYDGGGME